MKLSLDNLQNLYMIIMHSFCIHDCLLVYNWCLGSNGSYWKSYEFNHRKLILRSKHKFPIFALLGEIFLHFKRCKKFEESQKSGWKAKKTQLSGIKVYPIEICGKLGSGKSRQGLDAIINFFFVHDEYIMHPFPSCRTRNRLIG